jgi:hypothetical protein
MSDQPLMTTEYRCRMGRNLKKPLDKMRQCWFEHSTIAIKLQAETLRCRETGRPALGDPCWWCARLRQGYVRGSHGNTGWALLESANGDAPA